MPAFNAAPAATSSSYYDVYLMIHYHGRPPLTDDGCHEELLSVLEDRGIAEAPRILRRREAAAIFRDDASN